MKRFKLFIFTLVVALSVNATVYYVSPDGDGSTGLSWTTAFKTLLDAQKSVASPCEIWVKQAIYNVTDTTLTIYSGVNVYGGFAGNETNLSARSKNAALTVLNGNKKRRVLSASSALTIETIWDGFTIQNGSSANAGGVSLLKNATLQNCIVQNCKNTTNSGGGVYMATATMDSVKLINCVVKNNIVYYNGTSTSPAGGGGVYVLPGSFTAIIRGCTIMGNVVDGESFSGAKMYGGGVFLCDGSIINTVISNNKATSLDPGTNALTVTGNVHAGGIMIMPGATTAEIVVNGCKITNNLTDVGQGGGMRIDPYWTGTAVSGKVRILNSVVTNNFSRMAGGGIMCDSQNASSTIDYYFENCIFGNNETQLSQGGGVFINNKTPTTVRFANCNIVNNRMDTYNYGGAGIYFNNIACDITNCLFWGNLNAGTAPLKHHLRTAGVAGNSVIYSAFDSRYRELEISPTAFPAILDGKVSLALANSGTDSVYVKFMNPTTFTGTAKTATDSLAITNANWAISGTSACVDAGATIRTLTNDIIGTARPLGNGYDIGAYEFDVTAGVKNVVESKSLAYGISGAILLKNVDNEPEATVYNLMGSVLRKIKLTSAENRIELPANQLYLVKSGKLSVKVLVR